jgi:hypothetical protein
VIGVADAIEVLSPVLQDDRVIREVGWEFDRIDGCGATEFFFDA